MTMLGETVKRLEKLAGRISYKPWIHLKFDFDYDIAAQEIKVVMVTRVPDSTVKPVEDRVPRIPVISDDSRDQKFFDDKTDQEIIVFLYTMVSSFERHEQGEWFKFDGERWFNPHKED